MFTVIETPIFQKQASYVWSQDERHAFIGNLNEDEVVLLVAVYAKSDQANLAVRQIKRK